MIRCELITHTLLQSKNIHVTFVGKIEKFLFILIQYSYSLVTENVRVVALINGFGRDGLAREGEREQR